MSKEWEKFIDSMSASELKTGLFAKLEKEFGGGENAVDLVRRWLREEVELSVAYRESYFTYKGRFKGPPDFIFETGTNRPTKNVIVKEFGIPRLPESLPDWGRLIDRTQAFLGDTLSLDVSPATFKKKYELLLEEVQKEFSIKNLLNSVCYPVVLPKGVIDDPGRVFNLVIEGALKKAVISEYVFHGYRVSDNRGLAVVPESGCLELFNLMEKQPVVALFFPDAFRSRGVKDARRAMEWLRPAGFVLGDIVTNGIAICTHPVELCTFPSENSKPGLDCGATYWRHAPERTITFESTAYNRFLNFRNENGDPDSSSPLFFIGQELAEEARRYLKEDPTREQAKGNLVEVVKFPPVVSFSS